MTTRRALSRPFVTVFVSRSVSFATRAANLAAGYLRHGKTSALLEGGTGKAIGETAKFLKEQGKVETG